MLVAFFLCMYVSDVLGKYPIANRGVTAKESRADIFSCAFFPTPHFTISIFPQPQMQNLNQQTGTLDTEI